jgi:hypothetical protein
MGNQTSGSSSDERIYNFDLRLCGCSGHDQFVPTKQQQQRTVPLASPGLDRIEQSRLAINALEQVFVYGSEDTVVLQDVGVAGKTPYFASDGYLVDLSGRRLPESEILAALPVDLARLGDTLTWPPRQSEPFGELPIDSTNVNVGFARNSFKFGDGHSVVTVGAAIPKILGLMNGGAMLWVTSAQVITQGTGKFAGARGIQSFAGTSFFPRWPAAPRDRIGLLTKPFKAKIHRCIRAVLKDNL